MSLYLLWLLSWISEGARSDGKIQLINWVVRKFCFTSHNVFIFYIKSVLPWYIFLLFCTQSVSCSFMITEVKWWDSRELKVQYLWGILDFGSNSLPFWLLVLAWTASSTKIQVCCQGILAFFFFSQTHTTGAGIARTVILSYGNKN